ncbi:hypothetical protein BC829DRAFT_134599 [Chytridium lagenaria]|nr:hypothetical protein BC829DRAFT_134599 [Chytridium lagenaria]
MTNLHSFVADYVRRTIASEGRRKAMLEVLSKGEPFCVEENMIVAMVDIAGYSSLASTLEGLMGKLSSEVITQTVGSYLGKIAEVVFQYHGDIVKFLGDIARLNSILITLSGDAILVSFSAVDQNEDQQSVRRRAVSCCLEVLVKYPTQKIQLESWTQMLRATTKVERGTRDYDSGAVTRAEEGHQKSYSLSLHVALAEGPGSHVIIGVPSERLDYLVYSDSLRNLGKMLDGTKSGEMGIPVDLALSLELEVFASRADNGFFVLNGDPLKMAWDTIKESGAVLKPILKRTAISRSNLDISRSMTKTNNDEIKLLKNFVNKSILWRLDEQVEPAQEISDSSSQARRSSLRIRMPEKVLNGGVIRTEYRTISILFIKINDTFDSMIAQKLFTFLLDKLKTFDGVFQQYSVDDKGQSMLACFGLPPFIHEKCALFAVKAGASFMADLTKEHLKSITVGITTGDILFGTVGTENRRDTALLGDMINVAARLLSLKKEGTIVMDEYTKNLVETAFPVDDLGLVNLKGKAAPVRVWNISSFTPLIRRKTIYRDFLIQNKLERGRLENGVASWMNSRPEKCIFLIEGESGMGKSNLLSFLQRILRTSTVEPCIAHGSEVEQYNPYFAVREVSHK